MEFLSVRQNFLHRQNRKSLYGIVMPVSQNDSLINTGLCFNEKKAFFTFYKN